MNQDKKTIKAPLPESAIFKNMLVAIFTVSTVFLIKNLLSKAWQGVITIGICLAAFSILAFVMKKLDINQERRQFILCICLVFLVFAISLNSGAYYSDDFPLYLGVIGLSGLYLVPKYTLVQAVLIDLLLLAAYFIHPEKADPFSQYIMCIAMFSVGAITIYMVIKRGRAYIELGKLRAEEAENLLQKLKNTGEELEENCSHSAARVSQLKTANIHLENSISQLKLGSSDITQGTTDVIGTFLDVQERMLATENQIEQMNQGVKHVEASLNENKQGILSITSEIESLRDTIQSTNEVFLALQSEIIEISKVTEQLTSIASNTNMLALNASIEAARAGQMGAGFAIVASKVQELAEDSNRCSSQVVSVVKAMQKRIEDTSCQLADSSTAIHSSMESIESFQASFDNLTVQFDSLYRNIEEQNDSMHQIDSLFEDLKGKISEMADSSVANQDSVTAMTDAVHLYKDNMDMVVKDNMAIHQLSASMLELSQN